MEKVSICARIQDLFMMNKDNQECVDCSNPCPMFASLAYGTFLCSDCCLEHNALGSKSNIKSLDHEFSASEVSILAAGGNLALKEFFCYYDIQTSLISYKYKTYAAEFYRTMLVAISQNKVFEGEFPSKEEAMRIVRDQNEEIQQKFQEVKEESPEKGERNGGEEQENSFFYQICRCFYRERNENNAGLNNSRGENIELVTLARKKIKKTLKNIRRNETFVYATNSISQAASSFASEVKLKYQRMAEVKDYFARNTNEKVIENQIEKNSPLKEKNSADYLSTEEMSNDSIITNWKARNDI